MTRAEVYAILGPPKYTHRFFNQFHGCDWQSTWGSVTISFFTEGFTPRSSDRAGFVQFAATPQGGFLDRIRAWLGLGNGAEASKE
jgi:hypothetical protein